MTIYLYLLINFKNELIDSKMNSEFNYYTRLIKKILLLS